MTTTEQTFQAIQKAVSDFLKNEGVLAPEVAVEKAEFSTHGDVTVKAALRYAKELKVAPLELAEKIAKFVRVGIESGNISGVADVQVAKPGYVNMFLTPEFFAGVVKDVRELGASYGKNDTERGKLWAIEHTSPNPNKAMHLGHLRNNLVGMSIVHLLEWSGATVKTDAVDNNRGIAIAKMMYGFLAHMKRGQEGDSAATTAAKTGGKKSVTRENTDTLLKAWIVAPENWNSPADLKMLPDVFATECYILGEKDFKNPEMPEIEKEVRDLVVQWEAHDEDVWKLWAHVLAFSYAGIERTLTRLGNRWDKVWHEHEHYEEGKDFVDRGLKLGVFKTLEDGAVLSDLASYNLPDTILRKNDGTALYITQDLALTAHKKDFYHADHLVWVIGPEQSLAMKQLFAICEQLGIGKLSEFTHIPYGYVGLKDDEGNFKKMSSREGTVVLIDDVIDTVRAKILEILEESERNTTRSKEMLAETAEKLALAAVKFSILRSDRNQDIAFDIKQSVETKGDSGVYVLYTYARAQSILKKAAAGEKVKMEKLAGAAASEHEGAGTPVDAQKDVARLLMSFPQVVERATAGFSAHFIAQYLLELCGAFNTWYAHTVILDGSADEAEKLALVKAFAQVSENALTIMGIQTVEEI